MSKKHSISLDSETKSFIIGSRLGDGGFVKKSETHNTYIVFSHCELQLEYLWWKYNFLKNKNMLNPNQKIKLKNQEARHCYNNAQNQYSFSTKSFPELNIYKKCSRSYLIENLDELSLSIYILDDGNFYNKCCKISCNIFSQNEQNLFIFTLKDKFNIECNIYNHPTNKSKDYFRINKKEYLKIENIILKNIPNNLDIIKKLYK